MYKIRYYRVQPSTKLSTYGAELSAQHKSLRSYALNILAKAFGIVSNICEVIVDAC